MEAWTREARQRDLPIVSFFSVSHLQIALAYLAGYVLLDWLSYVPPVSSYGISPWNPPTGLSFALVLLLGKEYIPWLFVAPFVASALVLGLPLPIWTHAVGAAIVGASYGAATTLLSARAVDFDRTLASKRSILLLLGAGALSAAIVSISFVGLLVAAGALPPGEWGAATLRLWIGDMIGITVLTPFLLILFTRRRMLAPSWEIGAIAAIMLTAIAAVFSLTEAFRLELFYLFFLPVIWTAVRFGLEGVTAGLVLTQLGLMAAIHITGVSGNDVTAFQALMMILAMTGLAIGVLVSEQQRTQHELRLNQEALERAARLDTMGAFAAALAHEINQPLTAIANYTRLVKNLVERQPIDQRAAAEGAQHAIVQVDRAAQVVRRLRDIVRLGRNELTKQNVGELIREAVTHCRTELTASAVQIDMRLARSLPLAVVDGLQIQQVLINLVRNAAEAISGSGKGGGRVVIETALTEGGRILIRVADNGPGFDPDMLGRALAPFTTTKVEGLGLGLALARSTVETHGGQLTIESTREGATVSFTIPAEDTSEHRLS